jgi:hypothetical protein
MDYGIVVVLVVIIVIGLVIIRRMPAQNSHKPRRRTSSAAFGRPNYREQWQRIEGIMAQPGLESSRSAIFEADKLLDAALQQAGFRGETMGERLKNARSHFSNAVVYQGLWDAHKMRNAMAHEIGFDLPKAVAQQQLDKFRAGLQYLKVL